MAKAGIGTVLLAVCAGALAGLAVQWFAHEPPAVVDAAPVAATVSREELEGVEQAIERLNARVDEIAMVSRTASTEIAELTRKYEEPSATSLPDAATEQIARALTEKLAGSGATEVSSSGGTHVRFTSRPSVVRLNGLATGPGTLSGASEDERWEKMREELSLDSYQLDEMKRIRDDLRQGMKDMFAVDASGQRNFDFGKLSKLRKEAGDRVKNLLSEQQYDKYESGGYGSALGIGGGATMIYTSTVQTTSEDEGK